VSRVLVAGAGLAGTLLAGILARSGFEVVLAEQRSRKSEIGAGVTLHGNGNAALQNTGLGAALATVGRPIGRLDVHVLDQDETPTTGASVDIAALWPDTTPALAVHRQELHSLLLRHVGDVDVRLGSRVTRVAPHGDRMTATIGDGPAQPFDLVVGADGIGSAVRAAVDPDARPRDLGQTYLRTVADLQGEVDVDWAVWHRQDANAGLLRLRDGCFHVFVQLSGPRRGLAGRGMAGVLAEVFPDVPELTGAAGRVGRAHVTQVARVSCESGRGAVALVGDAAHGTSPVLSQGASLAFEDVVVLGEELARGDTVGGIDRYRAQRRARIAWLHRMTRLHSGAVRRPWTASAADLDAVYRQTYAGFADAVTARPSERPVEVGAS